MFRILLAVAAVAVTAIAYSTDTSNTSLPLRGGPDLVYAGNCGALCQCLIAVTGPSRVQRSTDREVWGATN